VAFLSWCSRASGRSRTEAGDRVDATLESVSWFNNRCLLKPIGNIPSAEGEANLCAANSALHMSA
jgi:hypothetical protein